MFALPIGIAYQFSDWFQNQYVSAWIEYLTKQHCSITIYYSIYYLVIMVAPSYGTYSLVWALPVVILISYDAIIDQTGSKLTTRWAIEPSMLWIGLQGNDIVPLLEGFM